MAKYTSTASIELEVNGAPAKKKLKELKDDVERLNKKLLETEDAAEFRRLNKKLKETQKELLIMTSTTQQVADVMARLDKTSLKDLKKTLKTLRSELSKMERGSEAWQQQAERIRMVKAEIDKVNSTLKESGTSGFKYFIERQITGWTVLITHITHAAKMVEEYVNKYASMQAEEANVIKYTGMSEEDVNRLNEEFKKMDTRTSREELNRLAQEAGRLGKTSVEDVLGFVKAADKINVALDDLGEGATLTLSKLTGIFGVEKELGTEKSLLAVGSVINELSQNSTAGAGYLAEFSKRMAGVGAQADLTIQQIMAFGAVLDAQGQNVEASSTALSQLIMKMYKDPAAMAKAAGMDVKEFSAAVKRDANEALLMLLGTLKQYGGIDSLASVFGDMKTDGARMSAMLAALAGNVETVKWQQEEANKAFAEATSIGNEFAVQNNTVQARLDKSRKRITEITVELGEKLVPVMELTLNTTAGLMKLLQVSVNFITNYRGAIIGATGAYLIYKGIVAAVAAREKIMAAITATTSALTKARTAAILLYNSILGKTTSVARAATAANKELNASLLKSAWGVVIALIGMAVGALIQWGNKCSENIRKQKEMAEARKKYQQDIRDISKTSEEYYSKEITSLKHLYDAATDESLAKEERVKAAEKLIKAYPDQFGAMNTEQIMLGKAKTAYDDLTESIILNAKAKAAADKVMENEKKILDLNEELKKNRKSYNEADDEYKAIEATRRRQAKERASGFQNLADANEQYNPTYYLDDGSAARKKRKAAGAAIDQNKRDRDELRAANDDLYREFKDNKSFQQQMGAGVEDGSGTESETKTYTRTLSDKERKKLEAEARRAAIKARKEFKAELDAVKAERDNEIASLMMQRSAGEIDYRKYTEAKFEAEKKFYDDSIALYEKWNLKEDDDHAALMKKREEHEAKSSEVRLNLNRDVIRRVAAEEERDINYRYSFKKNKTLSDEMQLQEELLKVRYNALMDEQALYDKGSKEYEELGLKINELLYNDMLAKKKLLFDKEKEFRQKFDKLSVKEKYDLEVAALEELHKRKKISEEEFQRWKTALAKGFAKDSAEEKKSLPGSSKDSSKSKAGEARKQYDSKKADLDEALRKGVIDEKEYAERLSRIKAEMNAALVDPLRTAQSEWVAMITQAYQAWADFANALKDPEADPFETLAAGIAATASIVSAVMEQITAFSEAELQIQTKAVEKRYDREIAFAEGNAYLTKKLEKEKQDELNELKAEQAKKDFQMQVIATIAQTAANAVQAYGAALKIPGAGLIMAPIAAAMAVAQGAVQIALLKKQQQAAAAVGYSEGGFTRPGRKDEPAGIVHAGEWVASQKLVNSPKTRPLIEMLEYAQRNNRIGSITMQDVSRSVSAPMFNAYAPAASAPAVVVTQPSATESNAGDTGLSEAIARLNSRLERPFVTVNSVTGEGGIKEAERRYNRMINNKSRKKRS